MHGPLRWRPGAYSVADLMACGPHAAFEDLSDTDRVLEAILASHQG